MLRIAQYLVRVSYATRFVSTESKICPAATLRAAAGQVVRKSRAEV
jgi:hypothetical protein